MAWYRCYIHSVGGGIECEGPIEFNDKDSAYEYAYEMAISDYESFEGYHGIISAADIFDCPEDFGLKDSCSRDEIWEVYQEIKEDAIDYWIVEAKDETDIDEDYQ